MTKKYKPFSHEAAQARQDRLSEKIYGPTPSYDGTDEEHGSAPQEGSPAYWYIAFLTPKGGRLRGKLLGPFLSEDAAEKFAEKSGIESPEFKNYPTKDLSRATRHWKAEIIGEEGIEAVPERVGHKKSLDQDKKREAKKKGGLFR